MKLGTVLTIVFIVLKICGVIYWDWIWVLSPLWISAAIKLAIIAILLLIAFIGDLLEGWLNND